MTNSSTSDIFQKDLQDMALYNILPMPIKSQMHATNSGLKEILSTSCKDYVLNGLYQIEFDLKNNINDPVYSIFKKNFKVVDEDEWFNENMREELSGPKRKEFTLVVEKSLMDYKTALPRFKNDKEELNKFHTYVKQNNIPVVCDDFIEKINGYIETVKKLAEQLEQYFDAPVQLQDKNVSRDLAAEYGNSLKTTNTSNDGEEEGTHDDDLEKQVREKFIGMTMRFKKLPLIQALQDGDVDTLFGLFEEISSSHDALMNKTSSPFHMKKMAHLRYLKVGARVTANGSMETFEQLFLVTMAPDLIKLAGTKIGEETLRGTIV